MAVLAHPDDESFGPGGTLAKAAAEGVEVHVITLTDGAAGTTDADLEEGELAEIRASELRRAAVVLGVTLHHLGHRDSGFGDPVAGAHPEALVNAPRQEVVAELVDLFQEIRPDVVMTHDETGGYFHPDHIRAHEVTLAAFEASAPWRPHRLYVEVTSDRWMKVAVATMRLLRRDPTQVGVNNDIDLTRVGVPASSITTRVDIRSAWAAKKAAGSCHASQGGGPPQSRYLPLPLLKLIFPSETFVRLIPEPARGLRESSLFEGWE